MIFPQCERFAGGFKHFLFSIWDVILPIDELIFFKLVIAPPTSNVSPWQPWLMGAVALVALPWRAAGIAT
jgi:hypothetical protein